MTTVAGISHLLSSVLLLEEITSFDSLFVSMNKGDGGEGKSDPVPLEDTTARERGIEGRLRESTTIEASKI
ncbi:MAG: hypothetical protein F6K14_21105 [Symploca sp. SIO2C1]|nr:hypothetical protein [Symploca sp. SIO2C1]